MPIPGLQRGLNILQVGIVAGLLVQRGQPQLLIKIQYCAAAVQLYRLQILFSQ